MPTTPEMAGGVAQSTGAGFTPGPWEVEGPLREGAYRIRSSLGLVAYAGNGFNIGYVKNDARLIAASPTMYEALERIANNAGVMADDAEQTATSRRWWAICRDDARAALSKARPNA